MEGHESEFVRGTRTKAVHAGHYVDPLTGAVVPPIYLSSTYEVHPDEPFKYIYGRFGNPTRTVLEKQICALEKGKHCLVTTSGMAAVSVVYHLLKPGEHVVSSDDLYGGTTSYLNGLGKEKQGIALDMIDLLEPKNLVAAIKENTRMVIIESPTNPTLKVLDIATIAKICKEKKLILVVDNTFFTPILQNPLELGADIVIHSCTKYIAGHADVIMGAVVTNNDDLYTEMKKGYDVLGCNSSPLDCYLATRGVKTLPIRVRAQEETAKKVAEVLSAHPAIEKVLYPGLPSHPGHELVKKQARGFGSMITFFIKGDKSKAYKFYESLQIFGKAVSLGGVESLCSIPVMVTHKAVPLEVREKLGITENLIRLAIGLEDFEDLRDDLLNALSKI